MADLHFPDTDGYREHMRRVSLGLELASCNGNCRACTQQKDYPFSFREGMENPGCPNPPGWDKALQSVNPVNQKHFPAHVQMSDKVNDRGERQPIG